MIVVLVGGRFSIIADALIVLSVVVLYLYTGKYVFLLLAPIPVLIDIFLTNGAGRSYRGDIAMTIVSLALIGVLNG